MPRPWERLFGFNDDSSRYLWKLYAAQNLMATFRRDPAALSAQAAQQLNKDSAEDVLHPPAQTAAFRTPAALRRAYDAGTLLRLPTDVRITGLRVMPRTGVRLFRGLRPEALATALYIGARVRAGAGNPRTFLRLVGAARTGSLPDLHATGWSFDIQRKYTSDAQARAFQAVLDRLQSLNLIAYIYEPDAMHITVAKDAAAFEPLIDRVR